MTKLIDEIDDTIDQPTRRTWLKLAGVGAIGAASVLPACTQSSSANETPTAAPAVDPDALAIMSSNENPFGPSPMAMEAMRAQVGNIYRYTGPLTAKFAGIIAEREGVAPEQVLVTNGSSPILAAFADWVSMQGGDIITSAVTYEGVPRVAEKVGVNVIYTPLTADMGYDLDAMAAQIGPNTGAVYLCNPNNPTGKTIDSVALKDFVEMASAQVPVFIDEAYLDMADDYPAGVMTQFVSAGRPVVVARTFSKLYAMAGQRIGYALMPEGMAMDMRRSGRLSRSRPEAHLAHRPGSRRCRAGHRRHRNSPRNDRHRHHRLCREHHRRDPERGAEHLERSLPAADHARARRNLGDPQAPGLAGQPYAGRHLAECPAGAAQRPAGHLRRNTAYTGRAGVRPGPGHSRRAGQSGDAKRFQQRCACEYECFARRCRYPRRRSDKTLTPSDGR